ncbi:MULTISPECIES: hypothetical protein [unclassified Streptomyces]|nr:hypothetical protein [Streptomyces sp. NBC_01445]WSE05797.1 hypothetical protein OG574_22000 [Streptomyces sp. NBC_01445]
MVPLKPVVGKQQPKSGVEDPAPGNHVDHVSGKPHRQAPADGVKLHGN